MALCHECLKLVTDLIACRLLFREFLLQPVYAIHARTDLLKRRGIVCIRPQPASRYPATKQITHASPATRRDTRRYESRLLNRCIEHREQARDRHRQFVPKKEIDELYLNSPYFIAPDGEVGQQAVRRDSRSHQ